MATETHHAAEPSVPAHRDQGRDTLRRLLDITAQLVAVLDPIQFMDTLVQQLTEAVPSAQACVLWLFERQQGVLRAAAVHGIKQAQQRDALSRVHYRLGEGLPGMTARIGEPMLVVGRARYRDMTGAVSLRNQASVRHFLEALPQDITALLLPLTNGSDVIGVLELLDLQSCQPPDEDLLQDVVTFAHVASGMLKQTQFHAKMRVDQRRLEVFGAISTAVSTAADLDELMGNVLDVMLNVTEASTGALFLYNPAHSTLTLGAQRRLPHAFATQHADFAIAGSMCEDSVRYGQPISRPLLHDSTEDPMIEQGFTSCLHLPLLAGGTVTGVVCVYSRSSLYDRVDVQSLMLMGSLVGFAIANVLLYQMSDIERRRLFAVINSIAEGVVLCDDEGRIVMANQTAKTVLALETLQEQQSFTTMVDFYVMRDLDGVPISFDRLPLARALGGEAFYDQRLLVQGADNTDVVISFSGAPVHGDDTAIEGAIVVFRDVTAMQKIESAKDEFLAVAAHELRSPLAAVRSYADLLVRREQRRESESLEIHGLTLLAQQVSHMLHLVDNLLDVSRLDADQFSLELEPVDLVALIEQMLEQQRPAAGDRPLQLDSAPPDLIVLCDQMRIYQVLTNVTSNAIRYSKPGQRVGVSVDTHRAAALAERYPAFLAAASCPYEPDDAFAVIAVEDHGIGIPREQRERLFQRYARGQSRRNEGLGLGLYLSHEFVMRHGGSIWFESVEQEGSTFYVALPMQPRQHATSEAQSPEHGAFERRA